jgi:hypothetical protein
MPIRPAFLPGMAFCRGPRGRSNVLASSSPLHKAYTTTPPTLGILPTRQLNLWQQRELKKLSSLSRSFSRHLSSVPSYPTKTLPKSTQAASELIDILAKSAKRERRRLLRLRRLPLFAKILTGITAFFLVSLICYETFPPSRHFLLALVRCSRLMKAVVLDIADYKWTFAKKYDPSLTEEELKEARRQARHACHARSSMRMLEALRTNAGIYVVSGGGNNGLDSSRIIPADSFVLVLYLC